MFCVRSGTLYATSLKCFFFVFAYLFVLLSSSSSWLFVCLFSSELPECSIVVVIIMLYSAADDYYSAVAALV